MHTLALALTITPAHMCAHTLRRFDSVHSVCFYASLMLMEEKKKGMGRDLPCKDDTREPGTGRALGGMLL